MQTLTTDTVRWNTDSNGSWLCINTRNAKAVCDALTSGKLYDISIKEHREKRGLTANSYYWTLVAKLSDKLQLSQNRVHNTMLRRYGTMETVNGNLVYVVVPDTDDAFDEAIEAETFHIKPTAEVKDGKDGNRYRTYLMLKGSHQYDTKEMSRLIDGIVSECQNCGIETLPPQKLEALYGGAL